MSEPFPAIRAPLQARSRATWARVLDAGVDLLEEGGYDALTIGALCERAGTTPPAIYARAGSKAGVLRAIYDHALDRINRTAIDPADPSWDTLTPDAVIRRAVLALCRTWLDNAALLRPIVHRAATDDEVFGRGSQTSQIEAVAFRAVLARAGIAEDRADAAFRVVYAALVQRVMYGERFESDRPLPDDELSEVLVAVVVGFVEI